MTNYFYFLCVIITFFLQYLVTASKDVGQSQEMTCVTGYVSVEGFSGETYYDDTQIKTCALGQTKCYKQTLSMLVENNWPGIYGSFSFQNTPTSP